MWILFVSAALVMDPGHSFGFQATAASLEQCRSLFAATMASPDFAAVTVKKAYCQSIAGDRVDLVLDGGGWSDDRYDVARR